MRVYPPPGYSDNRKYLALAGPFRNVIMAVILGIVGVRCAGAAPWLAGFAFRGVELSSYLALLT